MDLFLKIGGILSILVIPILLAFLNNKLPHLKHKQESKVESLRLSLEFEAQDLKIRSDLYKDRLAKSLFNNDALTYNEAKFFSQYENADCWVAQYAGIRNMLTRERDETGAITGFKPKSNLFKAFLFFVGYISLSSIGVIPLVIMNEYIAWMLSVYEKGILLIIPLQAFMPIISLLLGYLCLKNFDKYVDCRAFLRCFKRDAYKIPKIAIDETESTT
ncbi:hypothetical protein AMD27_16360 (plasmid) [Acinetobacter sp. TGL-Y2]|uniref:hypothetical protein n=1 Tax=Acinetobacter sp. TGL-Y2 TaxID=1407071 RepID=UPI0007A64450|nr:hypothetical protein [Acinetobacter sp. TGL-Y2]AMW80490.1 hypothetical protein AMD27_16360 [Acinetobacter sp. TGL-Y2]